MVPSDHDHPTMQTRLRPVLFLTLAVLFLAAPFAVGFDRNRGISITAATARAESGPGKYGDGVSGGDRDDDRDDHDDDDQDDDRDADDDEGDGRKDDDRSLSSSPKSGSGGMTSGADILRIEISASGIVVIYASGTREMIANGIYVREDRRGHVVERRRATGADSVRLRAIAAGRRDLTTATKPLDPSAQPVRIRISGRSVIVRYSNGWSEEVRGSRYRLTDRHGRTVSDRAATAADRDRLMALAGR